MECAPFDALSEDAVLLIQDNLLLEDLQSCACTCWHLHLLAMPRLRRVFRLQAAPWSMSSHSAHGKDVSCRNAGISAADMLVFNDAVRCGALTRCAALQLSCNKLGDAGVTTLAALLADGGLPRLDYLGLYRNDVGDAGCVALARSLAHRSVDDCLSALLLNSNLVGDEGLLALAAAARTGALSCLEKLCLSANRIGDRGVDGLSRAASQPRTSTP